MTAALITGISGTVLTADERAFLGDCKPAGLILFARNCVSSDQIRALVDDVRAAAGTEALLVLIDQEGGRVQRLKPPISRLLPPAAAYARLYAHDRDAGRAAAFAHARFVADSLARLGINTNCAPVLDVPVAGAHDIIGDRAYGATPDQIIDLGREIVSGFLAGGVVPVIKHLPGHGRATADSHLALPVVETSRAELHRTDFVPFKALADAPAAMTAHVVYTAIDRDHPASTSLIVTRDIIRGDMGFEGLLMSDDLSMKALTGPMRARAQAVIAAGSDVALHCNGDMVEMIEVAKGVPQLSHLALKRFERAYALTTACSSFDSAEAERLIDMAQAAHATATESV